MKTYALLTTLALATAAAQTTLPGDTARIHYAREDANYQDWGLHVWEDTTEQVEWQKPLAQSGQDDFGVYWDVKLKPGAKKLGLIVHKGDEKDPGPDMFANLAEGREFWVVSGDKTLFSKNPRPAAPPVAEGAVRVNYHRPDGRYEQWGLHAWEDTTAQVEWQKPLAQTGTSDFGAYWDVPVKTDWKKLGFIVHKGDEKDPGPDMFVNAADGNQVWIVSGTNKVFTQKPDLSVRQAGDLSQAQAHWLTRNLLAVKPQLTENGALVDLHYSPRGELKLGPAGISGGESIPLVRVFGGMNAELRARYPHLANYALLQIRPEEAARIPQILRSQLAVQSMGLDDRLVDATGVQIPGALDDLYAYDGPLGVSWDGEVPTLRVWAPTAQSVKLHLFDGDRPRVLDMQRSEQGVWSAAGQPGWKGKEYLYEVTVYSPATGKVEKNLVTDPYSLGLSLNSTRSGILDLNDGAHKPRGWDTLRKPQLASVNDLSLYELHLRDFSVRDQSVPAAERGTYLAFTRPDSAGMQHLRGLAQAGLKAVHLLPTFDIATIDEDKARWKTPGDLSQFPPNAEQQQAAIAAVKDQDPFNWGYDPYHYTVPEGSYAVNPEQRTLEYRRMVQALNQAGLRVVQDVVYNHTNAAGQAEKSVLDRIVPGYYHRLNLNGAVETSTCCANTATEHRMMEKLMIDSLLTWAREYKVDGFRFDLMGHHMLPNMQRVRRALDGLTLEKDGVDGRNIYVYGEGWNFGEVENNKRGVNATQLNLYGQGIGTFNDRIRDAIRGGNPFGGLQDQGFATGLVSLPNGRPQNDDKVRLLKLTDQIRVGLSGNLRDYRFTDAEGKQVSGAQLDYNGAPTGYAASPRESVNYASAHDNQTLFDAVLLKAPRAAGTAQRVRMHNLAMSLVALGQGIPFFHAGDDLLRSKSFDNDSYNSGDWFNAIDWTGQDNNFGQGLPNAEKNQDHWPLYRELLGDAKLAVSEADARRAAEHLREMLRVRTSSDLFRLQSAQDVQRSLRFLNTGPGQHPGLIVMQLSGQAGRDNPYREIVAVFNATGKPVAFDHPDLRKLKLELHPVLAESSDPTVRESRAASGTLSVPALTTAVFVGR